jgi:hypothetical protein
MSAVSQRLAKDRRGVGQLGQEALVARALVGVGVEAPDPDLEPRSGSFVSSKSGIMGAVGML